MKTRIFEIMSRTHIPRLTEAEYLQIERAAELKSEYFDGEMFRMAVSPPEHSLIGTNIAAHFSTQLKNRPCVAYNADLRMKIENTGLYTYPDLSIICGSLQFAEGTDDTVVNPSVLVEVISDSTEAYDRGRKFAHYRQIPTLTEYLVVSQKEARIEKFSRQPTGQWILSEANGLEATMEVPSLGIAISLSEVFANVKFPPPQPEQ